MDRPHISTSSITLNTSLASVWEALTNPEIAKQYFWGAKLETSWDVGTPILLKGEFNGHRYEEKGEILDFTPLVRLQYSHWSSFDGLADQPENYRIWTFELKEVGERVQLAVTEDNIPTNKQQRRSDEFWQEVLGKIKKIIEP